MKIHNFYYNESNRSLYIEFSLNNDSDNVYRKQELIFKDIELYSPIIVHEFDMRDIDVDFIIELLSEYYKNNDLPEEEFF